MAAQATLTLDTKVYNPRGVNAGIAKWVFTPDTEFGSSNAVATLSLSDGKTVNRIKAKLELPNLATDDTACGCAGTTTYSGLIAIDVVLPYQMTSAQRLAAYNRLVSLVSSTDFSKAVKDLEPVW